MKKPATLGSSKKTPVKQRARSATPSSASKKSPLQMVKKDHPAGFEHTKEAFYVHIKVLWGLIKQRAVPQSPPPEQVASFYQRFSSSDEIQSAIARGPNMIPMETIQTLKQAKEQRSKLGKHMMHLSDFNIRYVQTSMSQLGLWCWMPNLDEQPDSLYNEAHRICAIKTFRQLTSAGAYKYMNLTIIMFTTPSPK
ncbi:hypothetical protein VP01_1808g2 [Puccinia sorghi]|uniref:Uncharacterized protein n=1 Tax=Puccinia sorghi TaxID=27349 RepID=A0A0L6VG25_9BASI|nr:hypothetical protein VP01_1808g2 [Puccinia sorghi]